jgi:mannose-6-phosphate isomerase
MTIPVLLPLQPNRVWRTYLGGRELDRLRGIADCRDDHYPEDWLGSVTTAVNPGQPSNAQAGQSWVEFAGQRHGLAGLLKAHPGHFFSDAHLAAFGPQPEMLVKLLDAAERLQLQAHPTREFARRVLGRPHGKTEAYYIIATRPEVAVPHIYLGFQRPVGSAAFKAAVEAQNTDAILAGFERIPVRPGDVFMVPGGLPHAIGAGVLMVELMEPSDLVARFEFKQPGGYELPVAARFMGRDLEFALQFVDFSVYSPDEIRQRFFCRPGRTCEQDGSTRETLIDAALTPCFRLDRLRVSARLDCEADDYGLAVVVRGRGQVERSGEALELVPASAFLIPRSGGRLRFESDGGMEVLWVRPPDPRANANGHV